VERGTRELNFNIKEGERELWYGQKDKCQTLETLITLYKNCSKEKEGGKVQANYVIPRGGDHLGE